MGVRTSWTMLWLALVLVVGACTSEPAQVVVGSGADGEPASEATAAPEHAVPVPQELPIPSLWWIDQAAGDFVDPTLTFFDNPDGEGFLIGFPDGCIRIAFRTDQTAVYEVAAEQMSAVRCGFPLTASFVPGATFAATVLGDKLTIEIDGTVVIATAFESVSDHADATTVPPTTAPAVVEVSTTHGPEVWIDPNNAVIREPGGRWGAADVTPASGATTEILEWPFAGNTSKPACVQLGGLLSQPADGMAESTVRDQARWHTFNHLVIDVGVEAASISRAFREFIGQCAVVADGDGILYSISSLELDEYTDAFSLTEPDGESAWVEVSYRNNLLSILIVSETGTDRFTDADRDDFRRLVALAFDTLASA